MLTNSGVATIFIDICILLFMLTLKATQQLMPEILFIMYVSVRNNAEACLTHNAWDLVRMWCLSACKKNSISNFIFWDNVKILQIVTLSTLRMLDHAHQ